MVLQSRAWCFTLNNYSPSDVDRLSNLDLSSTGVRYLIFGREVSQSGTPHLQGFVSFQSKKRLGGVKTIIGDAHCAPSRSVQGSIDYCKKDGHFTELGECPVSKQGERNDLKKIQDLIRQGHHDTDWWLENHPDSWAQHLNFIKTYVKKNIRDNLPAPDPFPLRIWQAALWGFLRGPRDRRLIVFVVDPQGNTGKSWFMQYYEYYHARTYITTCSNYANQCHAYSETTRVAFIDVARTRMEYFSYEFIEHMKNGMFLSGKYESSVKRFLPPHCVVMCNERPNEAALSKDRYVIYDVNEANSSVCPAEGVPVGQRVIDKMTDSQLTDRARNIVRENYTAPFVDVADAPVRDVAVEPQPDIVFSHAEQTVVNTVDLTLESEDED